MTKEEKKLRMMGKRFDMRIQEFEERMKDPKEQAMWETAIQKRKEEEVKKT